MDPRFNEHSIAGMGSIIRYTGHRPKVDWTGIKLDGWSLHVNITDFFHSIHTYHRVPHHKMLREFQSCDKQVIYRFWLDHW